MNLDSVYRIWHTSHRLGCQLEHQLNRLPHDFLANATPGRITWDLNYAVSCDRDISGREGAPKHICFFERRAAVDIGKVSHRIFYGRRAVSAEFGVDSASMIDPSKHYYNVIERYRARTLQAAA